MSQRNGRRRSVAHFDKWVFRGRRDRDDVVAMQSDGVSAASGADPESTVRGCVQDAEVMVVIGFDDEFGRRCWHQGGHDLFNAQVGLGHTSDVAARAV